MQRLSSAAIPNKSNTTSPQPPPFVWRQHPSRSHQTSPLLSWLLDRQRLTSSSNLAPDLAQKTSELPHELPTVPSTDHPSVKNVPPCVTTRFVVRSELWAPSYPSTDATTDPTTRSLPQRHLYPRFANAQPLYVTPPQETYPPVIEEGRCCMSVSYEEVQTQQTNPLRNQSDASAQGTLSGPMTQEILQEQRLVTPPSQVPDKKPQPQTVQSIFTSQQPGPSEDSMFVSESKDKGASSWETSRTTTEAHSDASSDSCAEELPSSLKERMWGGGLVHSFGPAEASLLTLAQPKLDDEEEVREEVITPAHGPWSAIDFTSETSFFDDELWSLHRRRRGTPDFAASSSSSSSSSPDFESDAHSHDLRSSSSGSSDFSSGSDGPMITDNETFGAWIPLNDGSSSNSHLAERDGDLSKWTRQKIFIPASDKTRLFGQNPSFKDKDSLNGPITNKKSLSGKTKDIDENLFLVDERSDGKGSFAEKVSIQCRERKTTEEQHAVSSPDPSPSGPVREEKHIRMSTYDRAHPEERVGGQYNLEVEQEKAREVVEGAQRIAASVARADEIEATLELHNSGPTSSSRDGCFCREDYERRIEELRVEAEALRRTADEEMTKRQKALAELSALLEKENEKKLNDGQHTPVEIDDLKDLVFTGFDCLSIKDHGVVSLSLRIDKLSFRDRLSLIESVTGAFFIYAIVKLGTKELNCRLNERSWSPEEVSKNVLNDDPFEIPWRDTFNFPYINEKHISMSVRLKETGTACDHFLGAVRIGLESVIRTNSSQSLQNVNMFGEEGTQPSCTICIVITPSTDVVGLPYISLRAREIDTDNTSATDISAKDSITPDDHQDESAEDIPDFNKLPLLHYDVTGLQVCLVSLRGIKIGQKTRHARLQISCEICCGPNNEVHKLMSENVSPITIHNTKKGRYFAFIVFNEAGSIPINSDKGSVSFKLWNHTGSDDELLGSAEDLSITGILMCFKKDSLIGCRLAVTTASGRRVAYLTIAFRLLSGHQIELRPFSGVKQPLRTEKDLENAPLRTQSCIVTIDKCDQLVTPKHIPTNNIRPYVVVKIGKFEARTLTGSGPTYQWNIRGGSAQFSFFFTEGEETPLSLSLECFHRNDTEDGHDLSIGMTEICLADFIRAPSHVSRANLKIYNRMSEVTGCLAVQIAFRG